MSVIANLEPVPNRLRSLVRIIAATKELARDEVPEYLMPGSARKPDQVNNILREAIRMGLLQEINHKVVLGEAIRPRDVNDDEWFAKYADDRLVGQQLPASDDNRPVAFAIAWMLTHPIIPGLDWNGEYTAVIRNDLEGDDVYDITNASRMAMLAYWARFTGYAEALPSGSRVSLIPDPTRAIIRRLHQVFSKETSLTIPIFLDRLSAVAPVIEGGAIRSQVEERMRRPRDPVVLSQSTSFALLRLEQRRLVSLTSDSDADVRLLDLRQDGQRRVSHVSRSGG